jgi:protein-serine/threonine kinase
MPRESQGYLQSPGPLAQQLGNSMLTVHPLPRTESSHSWKSLLRFSSSSTKKVAVNGRSAALTLDTRSYSSPANGFMPKPISPNPALTPPSVTPGERSSYNSSNTGSSDSNSAAPSIAHYRHTPWNHGHSTYMQHQRSTDIYSVATSPDSRARTKSEKPRTTLGRSPQKPKATLLPQASITLPATPETPYTARQPGPPKSPKAMAASATRFIRRVASAPNVNGLFSSGMRSTSNVTTRNGMLAPSHDVPPIPTMSDSLEGADSMETSSSGSSTHRPSRPTRTFSASTSKASHGAQLAPGKAPFRRTYSSNSIKVRSVSDFSCWVYSFNWLSP